MSGIRKIWNARRWLIYVLLAAVGASLHFIWENIHAYPWAQVAAPLVPVNESYWEHGKLVVIPLTAYFIIQYFISFKNKRGKGLWPAAAAAGLWSALLSMFLIHAALMAAFGESIEIIISISTFLINLWIGMSVFHYFAAKSIGARNVGWAWAALVLLWGSTILYSFLPLPIELLRSTDLNYFGQNKPQ